MKAVLIENIRTAFLHYKVNNMSDRLPTGGYKLRTGDCQLPVAP